MSFDYLADLNREQRQAVEHGIKPGSTKGAGPLLVVAGAGSGKTKTLASRVAHLIVNGADPQRILLLTFSRRAAEEMTTRVRRIIASALKTVQARLSWSGTFHAIGARLLRQYAHQISLKPSFTILDRSDAADLMNLVRHDLGFSGKKIRFPLKETCLKIYSLSVNSAASIDRVLAKDHPHFIEWKEELRTLFARYTEAKQKQNVLDYDDLLLYSAEMIKDKELATEIGGRFDHVLVDEYQDTNRLQSKILLRLKPTGRGLMVVGDDAQSIYSFRAATVRNILDFPDQFKPRATVITLEENYRSTRPILDASNAVISLAKDRFTKNLRTSRQSKQRPLLTTVIDEAYQARHVCEEVLRAREAATLLKSQAVLFRASHHSAQLELELARHKIPFKKFGGLKFLEAAHVKDVISVLRWCENPRDKIAGFRILQLLPGIGPSTAAKILDSVERQRHVSKALASIGVPKATAADWPSFVKLVAALRKGEPGWPAEFQLVLKWYEPHLGRIHDDATIRLRDLVQLEQIAATYKSRQKFLTELTLDPPDATRGQGGTPVPDEDYLTLSTIHSAKGREWKCVHILNVVDGCIPSDMATGTAEEIEEERRLLYVAMTRAKDYLNLIVPQRFYTYKESNLADRHVYASVSRFIPEKIQPLFERRRWTDSTMMPDTIRRTSATPIDITSRLKQRWG